MNQAQYSAADFRKAREWVADCGGDLFPTFGSFEWFVRLHRDELLRSGELIVRRGSAGSLVGPNFDKVAIGILQRETAQQLTEPGA